MNTIELKKMIYLYLINKCKQVYDTQAPAKLNYPYIVYTLDTSSSDLNERREDFMLTIDIYDNTQLDSTKVEELAGKIDGDGAIANATGLHRKHYFVSGVLQADFYRTGRDTIEEDDENIQHRQLTYDVMCYLF
jgi:hypothetical protein